MNVLLVLCDTKVSLAVARRASDVWDLRNSWDWELALEKFASYYFQLNGGES